MENPVPRFDLPTVIAYAGIMSCAMGMIIEFLARTYPGSIKGLHAWTQATLLVGLATLTRIWLRGITSDEISVGAQNVCLILTAGLFLAGTAEFFERPLPRWFLKVLLVVSVLAMAVFATYADGPLHRRLFARGILIGLYGYHAWLIYQQPKSAVRYLTMGTLCSLVALIALRTVTGYLIPHADGVDSEAIIQVIYAVGFSSTDVLIPICGILMATEKVRTTFETLAMQDSLTGTLTRRALFEFGQNELAGCQRQHLPFAVLMLDLNRFKEINDTHGHRMGDQVLKDVANRIGSILRRPALLGRYGGDEFVVVLPGTSKEDAALVADRIRSSKAIRQDLPECQLSIGIAVSVPGQQDSLDSLIEAADRGLYTEKKGRLAYQAGDFLAVHQV